MTLFFDVLAMYLLIFPDFSGCASPSISVQIHDGTYSSIFVRYHLISSLIRPLVLSVLSRFCPIPGIFRKYVFVQFFSTPFKISLCSFEKFFRNNSGFFVYLLQNMSVRNICPVGHVRLLCPRGTMFCTFIFRRHCYPFSCDFLLKQIRDGRRTVPP